MVRVFYPFFEDRMSYKVFIDDNFHYMDEGERVALGEFVSADDALAAARRIVEESLIEFHKPGMSADEIYDLYLQFGSDPFIVSSDEPITFSAREYARQYSYNVGSKYSALSEWFVLTFDDEEIRFDVNPPGGDGWHAHVKWKSIVRVCFKAGDFIESDEVYIFTDVRPESYLFPTQAGGASDVWGEIIRRGHFDAELAIKAALSSGTLTCDPPPSADT